MVAAPYYSCRKISNFALVNFSKPDQPMRSRSIFITALLMLAGAAIIVAATPSRSVRKADSFVVVIDAGHGGKDYGAIGKVTNEKTINLNVARQIRDILAEDAPDIKVVMTRSDDRFVPLARRATIANKAKGDLFVSIHTNSVDKKNPNRLKVAGASVYSLGLGRTEENLAVAMRENAVMTLEPDYTTTYEGFDPNSAESYIIFEMDRDLHMEQSISAAKAVQEQLIQTARRSDRGCVRPVFSCSAPPPCPPYLWSSISYAILSRKSICTPIKGAENSDVLLQPES